MEEIISKEGQRLRRKAVDFAKFFPSHQVNVTVLSMLCPSYQVSSFFLIPVCPMNAACLISSKVSLQHYSFITLCKVTEHSLIWRSSDGVLLLALPGPR